MQQYLPYVQRLEGLLHPDSVPQPEWQAAAEQALNGEPSREIRRVVDLAVRRADGIFFTGSTLAQRLIDDAPTDVSRTDLFFDPACGAGDLLLAGARSLPIVKSSLRRTLNNWGKRIAGLDKHAHFVRATRARLAILAISRGAKPDIDTMAELKGLLPLVSSGNALDASELFQRADWFLLNPPFHIVTAPHDCGWTTGTTTSAALFLAHVINFARKGSMISAVLPDVLRSGSRYRAWREAITSITEIHSSRRYGIFDRSADIDVFLLHLSRSGNRSSRPWFRFPANRPRNVRTVGEFFSVRVGPVVPHRHKEEGPSVPYLHARALPRWEKVDRIVEKRRFSGVLFSPPFVAIRRTSRTGDSKRAVATIVAGTAPIAVENHLLVLVPKDASLAACQSLLRSLRSPKTDEWLNRRICCRHLTVDAMANLPFWGRTS